MLGREAPVRLDDLLRRHASPALEGVDVLREACVEVFLLSEETYEGMRQGGAEFPRSEFVSKSVDCNAANINEIDFGEFCLILTRFWVSAEEVDVEDSLGIRKI